MNTRQFELNERLNDCLRDFLRDYPDASAAEVMNGIQDTMSDALVIIAAHRDQEKSA